MQQTRGLFKKMMKKDEIFERKILLKIYGPLLDEGFWRRAKYSQHNQNK